MAVDDEVLAALLERDVFEGKGAAEGIARSGRDRGYAALSQAQKNVIDPLMTLPCDGVEDPGGHHNECTHILADNELLTAIGSEGYYDALLCTDCRADYYEWYE
ncbi:hypothetical protein [Yersinia mollaretii]|uniref:hypothetical protein n=1 Tax=Yersinia mollaretii TaxID=33060 RepID=UPI0005E1BBA5|nr:hypothetical protein [Yersinia mollaretii]CNF49088.1 Uncharacterised protein [Yersinia mollaretii]